MLKTHVHTIEGYLLEISKIPANSGHPLHKGTPREAFIRSFLEGHLSERVAIGTGEIIDANSKPNEKRNQIDIVIYRREYPRLDFGGGINGFLAESVIATIEVKSLLDKDELLKSARAAKSVKGLERSFVTSFAAGYQPPSIMSYVVAYDGPANMQTVHGWFPDINAAVEIDYPKLPIADHERLGIASPALDAIFLLGRGFIHFGNAPLGFFSSECLKANADAKWAIADVPRGSLFLLFLFLTTAISGVSGSWLNPLPYIKSFSIPSIFAYP